MTKGDDLGDALEKVVKGTGDQNSLKSVQTEVQDWVNKHPHASREQQQEEINKLNKELHKHGFKDLTITGFDQHGGLDLKDKQGHTAVEKNGHIYSATEKTVGKGKDAHKEFSTPASAAEMSVSSAGDLSKKEATSPGASPTEVHNSPGASPTEVHNSPGASPTEVHNSPGASPTEVHHSPGASPAAQNVEASSSPDSHQTDNWSNLYKKAGETLHTGKSGDQYLENAKEQVDAYQYRHDKQPYTVDNHNADGSVSEFHDPNGNDWKQNADGSWSEYSKGKPVKGMDKVALGKVTCDSNGFHGSGAEFNKAVAKEKVHSASSPGAPLPTPAG